MKSRRLWILATLVAASLGLVAFRLYPRVVANRSLQLDPITLNVFAGATRVDVFRLADFHENNRTEEEFKAIEQQKYGVVDTYTVTHRGLPQNAAFAGRLLTALQMANRVNGPSMPSCFDPGVGFRVWRQKAHTDIFVCYYCSGVEISTTDEHGRVVWKAHTELGAARGALLQLSREVFPDDRALQALKG